MNKTPPLTMTIDMAVLESLGINLYSNAAAVLTELVANAYDADATLVRIEWKNDESSVVVADDGHGMTRDELDDRFLVTGYQKRQVEGSHSEKWERPFMGSKGIGKLSIFSIADEVVVYSNKGSVSIGCTIIVDDLKEHIKQQKVYSPPEVDVPAEYFDSGTTIIMKRLKSKRVSITAAALRKRLARRFDVLDQTPRSEGGFKIEIDGSQLSHADRQDLQRLEYIWEFGELRLPANALPAVVKRFVLEDYKIDGRDDREVRGWIGTAPTPSDLVDKDGVGSLKNIMILARKRPIHEGIIDKLDFSRVFANYVTGQIEADFLDIDTEDDIATSDRQRLIEDDSRVQALHAFLREAFKKASDQWNAERPKRKAKDAFEQFPILKQWHDELPPWQQEAAHKIISTIAALPMDSENERSQRASLYRHGVLAFARIGLRENTQELDKLASVNAEELLRLLGAQGEYEASLWVDILRGRVESIRQLENLADENDLERVVQEHLFENLYLLDPAWERATEDIHMEEDLRRVDPGILATDDEDNEIRGRLDIRYRKSAGSHVIIELKRSGRNLTVEELAMQGQKYFDGLTSILQDQRRGDEKVEVVFVLGSNPRVVHKHTFLDDSGYTGNAFMSFGGRFVLYEELIANARGQYRSYLEKSKEANQLEQLLSSLEEDTESPPE
ncbi:BbrUII/HgiDII family restriction enzyme [Candidatus Poriferisodalis sp.]|uniref:BbrUII/HgiDII family restriction enzyme n=1 Tax=Candidatus Poriferisodalis sp. TaxID=3101277 RepID=UPI003D0AEBB9